MGRTERLKNIQRNPKWRLILYALAHTYLRVTIPQLRIITEEERKGQRAEMNSVKFKCANPLCSRSEVTFSDLCGNLHNVGKLVSYLHIVVLALELSIFKEHFKMYAKKGCSWTSVISYPFGTHIRGLLNLWLSHNTA